MKDLLQPDRLYATMIGDIVGSKKDPEHRRELQIELLAALERVNRAIPPLQRLTPTIGDEFQGVYAAVGDAIRASLRLRLELTGVARVRVGIGLDRITVQTPGLEPLAQDGEAWWAARGAIEEVADREKQRGRQRNLQVVFASVKQEEAVLIVNALLTAMDGLLSRMSIGDQELTLALLEGKTQQAIAEQLGITQSAIAQRAQKNGSYALLRVVDLLGKLGSWPT